VRTTKLVSISAAITIAATLVIFACTEEEVQTPSSSSSSGGPDAANKPKTDSGNQEEEEEEEDDGGGVKPKDAGADTTIISDAKPPRDANGPGEAGTECAFNRECQLALRCHDNGVSFTCSVGARGMGRLGIDRCDSGDQCASSVCLEGPDGGDFCSDECADPTECAGVLPRCIAVSFFPAKICVRQP
jgi:hypothetical protein